MATSSVNASGWQGFEIWFGAMRMNLKMIGEIGIFCAIFHAVAFYLIVNWLMPPMDLEIFWKMNYARIAQHFFMHPVINLYDGTMSGATLMASPVARKMSARALPELWKCFWYAAIVYPTLGRVLYKFFKKKSAKAIAVEHIRGMQLVTEKELAAQAKVSAKTQGKGILPFGSVVLPFKFEITHLMVAATTGQGKTVCLVQMLDALRKAGFPAIIFDLKGDLTQIFLRKGIDHLANPLDVRGIKWNIFDDFKTIVDVSALVDSLIPPAQGDQQFWSAAACAVLRGIICALYRMGPEYRTHAALWTALTSSNEDIAKLCASCPEGRAGFKYIGGDQRLADNTMASLVQYTAWLEFAQNGSGFSLDKWLENPGDSCLFITGLESVSTTLKPYIGLLIDLLSKKLLSLPNSDTRRIYFILDEFGNCQKLPTIKKLLSAGRQKGASVMLGFQDYASIVHIYGKEDAESILANCASSLCMKVPDEPTAKVFSNRFGMTEYWTTTETITMGVEDGKDGRSLVRQQKSELLILPSQIQDLPTLTGYLRIPECNPALITLKITDANKYPVIEKAFEEMPGIVWDEIMANEELLKAKANLLQKAQGSKTVGDEIEVEDFADTPPQEKSPAEQQVIYNNTNTMDL